ncbi:9982_t:CDS:10 [Diversispora eburnea]|uniref:9982_t:CDS:1 n=1 Tax=Diversispora eburnea TaxID=1213867 RepID=A0A9N8WCP9_9GLOM|nr:9982_t:CDS:10 [Diversispora eburnea]
MAQTYGQQQSQTPEHTLPGVIHFLQSEWRRFERDRNEWEIERAEMKARIALLEGERRGIENMKIDLMRRVKMLEFVLRQESKYLAGKLPTQSQSFTKESTSISTEEGPESNDIDSLKSSITSGRPILHHKNLSSTRDPKYRTKSREILKTNSAIFVGVNSNPNSYNEISLKKPGNVSIKPSRPAPSTPTTPSIASINSSSQLPLENPKDDIDVVPFEHEDGSYFPRYGEESMKKDVNFANNSNYENHSIENISVGNGIDEMMLNLNSENNNDHERGINYSSTNNKSKQIGEWKLNQVKNKSKLAYSKSASDLKEEEEQLTKDVQKKFNLSEDKVTKLMKNAKKRKSQEILSITSDPLLDELSLSVEDESPQKSEADRIYENGTDRKVWRQRFTLRSHLDAVRSLSWHRSELLLASGSEDGTVKLWDLKGSSSNKLTVVPDIEPLMTYRGHSAAVNSVVLGTEQHRCYSASMDSTVRVWNLPSSKRETYGPVDPSLNLTTYIGHTDAIWDLRLFPIHFQSTQLLASASADGTVKIWDTEAEGSPLKSTLYYYGNNSREIINGRPPAPIPTSVDFVHSDLKKIAVSFQNSIIKLFDVETGQDVLTFESNETYDNSPATQINYITIHPTMSLLFSAHEDKYIRFFDVNSGKCSFSMLAHLDSVTSLDVDPSGMILISGGHDNSIRLWDIVSTRQCIQEFVSHRRKSDEGVLSVKYHPSLPWISSGGADSIIKIHC